MLPLAFLDDTRPISSEERERGESGLAGLPHQTRAADWATTQRMVQAMSKHLTQGNARFPSSAWFFRLRHFLTGRSISRVSGKWSSLTCLLMYYVRQDHSCCTSPTLSQFCQNQSCQTCRHRSYGGILSNVHHPLYHNFLSECWQ